MSRRQTRCLPSLWSPHGESHGRRCQCRRPATAAHLYNGPVSTRPDAGRRRRPGRASPKKEAPRFLALAGIPTRPPAQGSAPGRPGCLSRRADTHRLQPATRRGEHTPGPRQAGFGNHRPSLLVTLPALVSASAHWPVRASGAPWARSGGSSSCYSCSRPPFA